MVIYGVALLAACTLVGVYLGELLARVLGVTANVGGVGFAMLMLVLLSPRVMSSRGAPATVQGLTFWNAIYIPIVVAMAAQQNVVAALRGGFVALLAGVLAVVVGAALVPVLDPTRRRAAAARQALETSS